MLFRKGPCSYRYSSKRVHQNTHSYAVKSSSARARQMQCYDLYVQSIMYAQLYINAHTHVHACTVTTVYFSYSELNLSSAKEIGAAM